MTIMAAEIAYRSREYITTEAYLEHSEVRHNNAEHELVAGNLFAALHAHLKGKPCHVFKDGMKLHVHAMGSNLFYYPDVMVTCDPPIIIVTIARNRSS